MQKRLKQGRLPFGLPRLTRPRSASAYAAFRRPASAHPPKHDTTVSEPADSKKADDTVAVPEE